MRLKLIILLPFFIATRSLAQPYDWNARAIEGLGAGTSDYAYCVGYNLGFASEDEIGHMPLGYRLSSTEYITPEDEKGPRQGEPSHALVWNCPGDHDTCVTEKTALGFPKRVDIPNCAFPLLYNPTKGKYFQIAKSVLYEFNFGQAKAEWKKQSLPNYQDFSDSKYSYSAQLGRLAILGLEGSQILFSIYDLNKKVSSKAVVAGETLWLWPYRNGDVQIIESSREVIVANFGLNAMLDVYDLNGNFKRSLKNINSELAQKYPFDLKDGHTRYFPHLYLNYDEQSRHLVLGYELRGEMLKTFYLDIEEDRILDVDETLVEFR